MLTEHNCGVVTWMRQNREGTTIASREWHYFDYEKIDHSIAQYVAPSLGSCDSLEMFERVRILRFPEAPEDPPASAALSWPAEHYTPLRCVSQSLKIHTISLLVHSCHEHYRSCICWFGAAAVVSTDHSPIARRTTSSSPDYFSVLPALIRCSMTSSLMYISARCG